MNVKIDYYYFKDWCIKYKNHLPTFIDFLAWDSRLNMFFTPYYFFYYIFTTLVRASDFLRSNTFLVLWALWSDTWALFVLSLLFIKFYCKGLTDAFFACWSPKAVTKLLLLLVRLRFLGYSMELLAEAFLEAYLCLDFWCWCWLVSLIPRTLTMFGFWWTTFGFWKR